MKKIVLSTILALCCVSMYTQAPERFNYQAVIRDASGNIRASANVTIQLSILQGSATGTVAYTESHSVQTNAFGLVNLAMGGGTVESGAISTIDWATGPYFIKVKIDGVEYGTTQVLSVPYALFAKKAANGFSGAWTDITGKPAFATVATSGSYNDLLNKPALFNGTWNSLTGKPSGFADDTDNVDDADNSATNEIQTLNLSGTTLSLSNGGGSVSLPASGGGDNWGTQTVVTDATLAGTGITAAPLKIAQQSATNGQVLKWNGITWSPASDLWLQSGSDIYFNAGKVGIGKIPGADSRQFQVLTTTNQAIAGVNNSTLGTIYAQNNGSGPAADFRNKILIMDGTQGPGKVLTSDAAGYTSWQTPAVVTDASFTGSGTTENPLKLASFGASAGQVLKWTGTAWDNAADDTGPFSETTNYIYNAEAKNFGMGISVPTNKLTLADGGNTCYMNIQNSSTGYTSLDGMLIGAYGLNSYVSTYEAGSLYFGTINTVRMAILSDGKVGIGTLTPSYKLDVAGAANLNRGVASGQALLVNGAEAIWYDGTYFSWGYGGTWNYFKDAVGIDCQPGDGHMLAVNGVASKPGGGTWTAFSDVRLKDIHGNYERGLEDIIRLEPVRFNYKEGNELKLPSKSEYVGFVAQDIQKVFPETVTETPSGYLEFDMHGVNVAVINAIKELKAENDELRARLKELEEKIDKGLF